MEENIENKHRSITYETNRKGNFRNPYGVLQKLINEILRKE